LHFVATFSKDSHQISQKQLYFDHDDDGLFIAAYMLGGLVPCRHLQWIHCTSSTLLQSTSFWKKSCEVLLILVVVVSLPEYARDVVIIIHCSSSKEESAVGRRTA
jgi:hypothetical protein